MANVFRSTASSMLNSPFVIVISLAFLVLLFISIGLSIEDYMTSLMGYQLLPTAKANNWIIPLVALLPQVGQITFAFAFATDTRKRWAGLVMFGLHFFDVLTDVYFKAHGQAAWVYGVALLESEVLYTLGSEIALVFSIGMLFELLPHAFSQFGVLISHFGKAVGLEHEETEDEPSIQMSRR